ncbi:MAG: hypothetical protein WA211_15465 [Candidatus Acidiferrales bacterium]
MNNTRKAITTLGGVLLAGLLLVALAPRAARGVAAALVQVSNTYSNPVPTSDVAPMQPYLSSCYANTLPISSEAACDLPVPAGKRLVVQSVGISVVASPGGRVVTAQLIATVSGNITNFPVAVPYLVSQSGVDYSTSSQALRLYSDDDLVCALMFNNANGASGTCVVSGYLVDVP